MRGEMQGELAAKIELARRTQIKTRPGGEGQAELACEIYRTQLREKDRLIEQAWLSGFASGCYWTVIAIVVWIAIVACLDAGYWAAG